MWKHAKDEHPEDAENVSFDMTIRGIFNRPLRRQISEGVAIQNKKKEENLNSKSEYNGPSVKRRTIEGLTKFCYLCNYRCKSDIGLIKHKRTMHVTNHIQCDQCDSILNSKDNLESHNRLHHRQDYTCDKTGNPLNKFTCDDCGEQFTSMRRLKHHEKTVHERYKSSQTKVKTDPTSSKLNIMTNATDQSSFYANPLKREVTLLLHAL